ncbi:hypothetical protein [Oceanobacter mangrovi]|uniref:hypothetical protein n=1 Tax=Oceanobacter mangrovi TaxID=2862510 RepID=UPI001C8DA226|nr:hypothetical protein [Oceanobacter mangrovi]
METKPYHVESWRDWIVPVAEEQLTLREILATALHLQAGQQDIPLIVQLVENPKFDIPGINLFNGAVGLEAHDCIHAILGRGMLPKDEAFVIGFTMGSSNRVTTTEERLFTLAAKYLYPGPYKFNDEDIHVFKDAVRLGFVSDCTPLAEVDYEPYMDMPIKQVRQEIGVEVELLKAYYQIERRRYPADKASQRTL